MILALLVLATAVIVLYAKGYRLGNGKDLSGTGVLVATSTPDGASVYINDHLTTATDNNLNLSPGEYKVRISKEGYFPWEKKIKIEKEVVSKANARLFPVAPQLQSITNLGVDSPVIDPTYTKIAYTVSGQSIKKNGVYILDMTTRPILTLQGSSSQIADDTVGLFSLAKLSFSPDGSELIASISAQNSLSSFLLRPNTFNENPSDVTATLANLKISWDKIKSDRDRSTIEGTPAKIRKMVKNNFKILSFSPDETKILYEASESATLPIIITPRLIGVNSTPEQRNIEKKVIYVYDIKEDRNYKIKDKLESERESLTWLPDSNHLVFVHDKEINIMEYDGTNNTKIYAGPFIDNYVFPWPDASKIVILTSLGNPDTSPNLYTISLK